MRKCFSRVPETTAQFAAHPVNTSREDNDTPHKQPPCFWNEWEKPLHAELHSSSDLPNRELWVLPRPLSIPQGKTSYSTSLSPLSPHSLSLPITKCPPLSWVPFCWNLVFLAASLSLLFWMPGQKLREKCAIIFTCTLTASLLSLVYV